jgi:hypothetical protein
MAFKSPDTPNGSPIHLEIDAGILNDPSKEVSATLDFYLNACAHLFNLLSDDPSLRTSPLCELLQQIFATFQTPPDKQNERDGIEAAKWLGLFGPVGKALWYLQPSADPQLRRELNRIANEPKQIIGNQFLFYIAGTLAANGHEIQFVPEQGKAERKTPDIRASKAGKDVWIEANAKQPVTALNTPEKISRLIRDIVAEKKLKFSDPKYSPGMIVADISPADPNVNEAGGTAEIKLRPELRKPLPNGGFIYRLFDDPEWELQPENQGNVVAYIVNEFRAIDRSKYHVFQCLITLSRRVVESGSALAFPKYHLLVVERSAEADALVELAKIVYVV